MIKLVICPLCKSEVLPMKSGQCPLCRQTPQWETSEVSISRKIRPLYSQKKYPAQEIPPQRSPAERKNQEIEKRKAPTISENPKPTVNQKSQTLKEQESGGLDASDKFIIGIVILWFLAFQLKDFQRVPSSPTTISSETARLLKIVRSGPSYRKLQAFNILYEDTSLHDRLVDILRETGDAQLAEAYLNASKKFWLSRGVKLEDAGREWARTHNCTLQAFQRSGITTRHTVSGC